MALSTPKTNTSARQPESEEQVTQASVAEPEQLQEEAQEGFQAPTSEPERQQTTTVAERPQASAPAKSGGGNQFESDMAEDGFEGLTLGGLSFEQIKLPGEGQFLIGQDDEELGQEFDCVIQVTRARYVVRQSDDQDAEMFYSYDPNGLTNTEGQDMSDTLQEWKEEGFERPVIKKYIEAMAIMIDEGGERDRMMVMLSIPPASVQKFSGFLAQQKMMKGAKPNEFITKCVVGKKVKKDKNSFFPWAFKNAGQAPELF